MMDRTDDAGSVAIDETQMRELVERAMALEAEGDLDGAIGAYEQPATPPTRSATTSPCSTSSNSSTRTR